MHFCAEELNALLALVPMFPEIKRWLETRVFFWIEKVV